MTKKNIVFKEIFLAQKPVEYEEVLNMLHSVDGDEYSISHVPDGLFITFSDDSTALIVETEETHTIN